MTTRSVPPAVLRAPWLGGAVLVLTLVIATPSPAGAAAPSAWTEVHDPHAGTLTSVSPLAEDDVWAAGYYYDQPQGRYRPLVEHWDGTRFSATVAPTASRGYNAFNGVAAVADDDVWAVGYQTPVYYTYVHAPLIEHFDGRAWRVVPSPYRSEGDLNAVVAIAADDVWAVGTRTINPYGSLLLHFDGTAWSIQADGHATDNTFIQAVAANGSSDVWVAGSTPQGTDTIAFAEHWNGASWTDHPAYPDAGDGAFNAIALDPAAGVLQAVGWQTPGLGAYQMAQRYQDGAWTDEPPPEMPANNNLYGVVSVGSRTWAVGYGSKSGPAPAVERWNGSAWRAEQLPVSGIATVYAIAAVGRTLWAVGDNAILRRSL